MTLDIANLQSLFHIVSLCDNYKCLNGGECTVGGNGKPSCKCKEGFVGEKCGNVAVQGPTNQGELFKAPKKCVFMFPIRMFFGEKPVGSVSSSL